MERRQVGQSSFTKQSSACRPVGKRRSRPSASRRANDGSVRLVVSVASVEVMAWLLGGTAEHDRHARAGASPRVEYEERGNREKEIEDGESGSPFLFSLFYLLFSLEGELRVRQRHHFPMHADLRHARMHVAQ